MHVPLATLIDRLGSFAMSGTSVIHWSCPVPSFGDISKARVATLGLNPSNREFEDEVGNKLRERSQRFHTLDSLRLASWSDADARHLRLILRSCHAYFEANPYDRWFKVLEQVVVGTKASYYAGVNRACHVDLIPYATSQKWTELTGRQRSLLLGVAGDTLGLLLRDSPVRILILNGRSVVDLFQDTTGSVLDSRKMPSWTLQRSSTPDVMGVAYRGVVESLSGIDLGRELLILGFNHNLQSSFGVTTGVIRAIRDWIARETNEANA